MRQAAAALLTAFLLFLSFPPYDLPVLCWVALVPLILVLRNVRPGIAWLVSCLCGFAFFSGLQHWCLGVGSFTALPFLLSHLLVSVYVGLFGFLACRFHRRMPRWSPLTFPAAWVVIEYVRSHAGILAWPFGILGYSQYRLTPALGMAAFAGVYGVSFLVVSANAALASVVEVAAARSGGRAVVRVPPSSTGAPEAWVALAAISLVLVACALRSDQAAPAASGLKVSLVQGKAAMSEKDDRDTRLTIFRAYLDQTARAADEGPALIVWPSASVPGTIPVEQALVKELGDVARTSRSHLLVGSAGFDKLSEEQRRERKIANSAFLFSPEGRIVGRYDKVRLLPFDEYYPLRGVVRWPSWIASAEMHDALPGKTPTLFRVADYRFGVLICWENYFPEHFRDLVRQGADFMVSMGNDSFTSSPAGRRQMLAMNVLRAVENGVFLLRVTAAGITAAVAPSGRVIGEVRGARGAEDVDGHLTTTIAPGRPRTFYFNHGNLFFGVVLAGFFVALVVSCTPDKRGGSA